MHISDFDYELPAELIAREPARPRDASRMMVINRENGSWIDSHFRDLPDFLQPSDVLVINDTRVIRARTYGRLERASGTTREIEVLFVAPAQPEFQGRTPNSEVQEFGVRPWNSWEVLCRPGKRIREGDRVIFADGELEGVFGESRDHGLRLLRLTSNKRVEDFLARHGHVPLPPYIEREDTAADAHEYQTIYAREPGAVAAPTAGLHFTESMFERLRGRGIEILKITLHVGIGTFMPVRAENPAEHVLKPERFEIGLETASRLNLARAEGRRIIAVGTTTTRTLEYIVDKHGKFEAGRGEADLFILPGHTFRGIDGMLTNLHLPRSTLLMLVSAFATRTAVMSAYRHAVEARYRFYSYGDCMLIL
jgi:S-adenosylmethionine:tRNA ribosyltransferase-isomerase